MSGVDAPIESPQTLAWEAAKKYVSKQQARKMQLGLSGALWNGLTKWVWGKMGQDYPLASDVLIFFGVGPSGTVSEATKDGVRTWAAGNKVPDFPESEDVARALVGKMVTALRLYAAAEEAEVTVRSATEEQALVTATQAAVEKALLDEAKNMAPLDGRQSGGSSDAKATLEAKKHARVQLAKEFTLKQGVHVYKMPPYYRLKDEAFHKILAFSPDGLRKMLSCSIVMPSYDELVKIGTRQARTREILWWARCVESECVLSVAGLHSALPAGYDTDVTMLCAILRTTYIALCKPSPEVCEIDVIHDAACISLTHTYEEKEENAVVAKNIECYPFFDYKVLCYLLDLAQSLKQVHDDTARMGYCRSFYDEFCNLLVNNSKQTINAVIGESDFYNIEPLKQARVTVSRQGKRKAPDGGASNTKGKGKGDGKSKKVEERLHPKGECKYWCSFGNCTNGDKCELKHVAESAGKYPGAHKYVGGNN